VRGYGALGRFPPNRAPWSRHDLGFASATASLVALCAGARFAGLAFFEPYPLLQMDAGAADVAFAVALPVLAIAPFRRGRAGRA
jgi:hypothetical protein